ncbi:MAG: hypothetical protein K6G10_12370 [Butyrivibrio sp.]|nr:hypothetical protein [Butyrivibrio sp.]
MYSEIIICLKNDTDEVLEKQVNMLKERHHARLLRMEAAEAEGYIKACSSEVLFISDDEDMISKAKKAGMATNTPASMREAYMKAMEMLKNLSMK